MSYIINDSIKAKYYGSIRSSEQIKYIVIHYTANSGTKATAKGNANYFHTCPREASAHYIVDTNNTIYQSVPDNYVAWSVGGGGKGTLKNIVNNTNSISIEMVSCSNSNGYYIPEETILRTIELTKDLMSKYGIKPENVVRHYDVTTKLCPEPFVRDAKQWENFKNKLIDNKEEEEMAERVYNWTTECPSWSIPTIQKLLDKKYLKGDENGQLGLTETAIKVFVILDRAGLFDK